MKAIYNLTPHSINIHLENGKVTTIESSGELRLASEPQGLGKTMVVDGHVIPTAERQRFTGLDTGSRGWSTFIKENARGGEVGFIVSAVVAEWICRPEAGPCPYAIFAPGTGPAFGVRDGKGQIIGTKRLEVYCIQAGVAAASSPSQ